MSVDSLTIQPLSAFSAVVRPPGSKSLTNRALLLAALARGRSVLRGVLWADDTRRMVEALSALGVTLTGRVGDDELVIDGQGGLPATGPIKLHLGNAGTAMRPLCAACCLGPGGPAPGGADPGPGVYELDGDPRMRERPIGELVEPLRTLGAHIEYLGQPGYPPLRVRGGGLRGGTLVMKPTLSSQFITALLMVAPLTAQGLVLRFDGPITSRPYVEMTLALMARFGAQVDVDQAFTRIVVRPGGGGGVSGGYHGLNYDIEPDASNASYFLAAPLVVPGSKCTVEGLGRGSLQGDVALADVLHQMGADVVFGRDFITVMTPDKFRPQGIDVDLNAMPDMAQTLAVVALFATGPTTLRNIGNLRVKETDRLAALVTELAKFGASATVEGDDLSITPPAAPAVPTAPIATYNDHRMAMSFALAGLRLRGVVIQDPACVNKTFPSYFEYLARLRPGPVA